MLCFCDNDTILSFVYQEGDSSTLDHSFSSLKELFSLCNDPHLPLRKIIGDRGGPASMKENVCQVRTIHSCVSLSVIRGGK